LPQFPDVQVPWNEQVPALDVHEPLVLAPLIVPVQVESDPFTESDVPDTFPECVPSEQLSVSAQPD
jgi:hypothetical protein